MKAADIVEMLGDCDVSGDVQREIIGIASLRKASIGDLTFCIRSSLHLLVGLAGCITIVPRNCTFQRSKTNTYLHVDNPRLAFARAATLLLSNDPSLHHERIVVDPSARIHPSVVIEGKVSIGPNVSVQALCTIGTSGFGYERDETGRWVFIPQIGGAIIGENVDIAAHTNVHRGTLDDTVIGDGSKISINCNIGHNVVIGKHTFVAGKCNFGGKTQIGDYCFIGMGTITRPEVVIGNGSIIGMGSIVTKNIPDNSMAYGNPCEIIKTNLRNGG